MSIYIYTKSNLSTARRKLLGSSWFSSRLDYIYIPHSAHHKGCSNKHFGPGQRQILLVLAKLSVRMLCQIGSCAPFRSVATYTLDSFTMLVIVIFYGGKMPTHTLVEIHCIAIANYTRIFSYCRKFAVQSDFRLRIPYVTTLSNVTARMTLDDIIIVARIT